MRIDFYCFNYDEFDNYSDFLDYASNTLHICSSWINVLVTVSGEMVVAICANLQEHALLTAYLANLIASEHSLPDDDDEDEA